MRPFENLLSLANLLTLILLVIPLPRAMGWMHLWVPVALLIAVAHVLVEGERWQMVPAYALTGLFLLVWLQQNIARAGERSGRKRTYGLAFGLGIGLGVFGLVISIILPHSVPVVTTVALLHFFYIWNETRQSALYLGDSPNLQMISFGIQRGQSFFFTHEALMVGALVAMAMPVLVLFLSQRFSMQDMIVTQIEK